MNGSLLVLGDPLMPAAQLGGPTRELLGRRFDVHLRDWELPVEEAVRANLLIEQGGPTAVEVPLEPDAVDDDVVAVLTQFFPLSARTLARWPRLRAVATLRAGTENVDTGELARRGVAFTANAGRNANAVAELAVALVMATLRGVGENHHSVRTGGWRPAPPALGHRELAGRRLGLVGLGAVGRLVARRASGFDLDVAFHDPWVPEPPPGLVPLGLEELLVRSDVLSLHARAADGAPPLLGARELDLLPPGAILVNTARAELLDEGALVERLRDGRLSGAGLDVFSVEPLPVDHPLRSTPGVTLSPHLAGATVEARSRAPELIADRLAALLGTA